MADNSTAPGTGETFAFDDIGGIKFGRSKIVHGADGTNDGDVSNANPLPVKHVSGTATRTQVADSASDGLILAANTARLGATIWNDSSAVLYLGLGTTTVTTTNYTAQLSEGAYYEVPFGFTGEVRGIWATDPGDGGARVTELT